MKHVTKVAWPTSSPDFKPLDYSVLGYMKELLHEQRTDDRSALLQRILNLQVTFRTPTTFLKM
jgi:hypothetical protein